MYGTMDMEISTLRREQALREVGIDHLLRKSRAQAANDTPVLTGGHPGAG